MGVKEGIVNFLVMISLLTMMVALFVGLWDLSMILFPYLDPPANGYEVGLPVRLKSVGQKA